ncbi:hypothetical protein HPB47_002525 [Ixodes persulcatus]|uniref:Uncharacterized protein n=1 Tax=Ixodes persulcatus TaxID=34615 RepID=A0AC60PKW8_IXOPE|nr:hypothetical protein HPB47_002525 [Ixodes persulcatus]
MREREGRHFIAVSELVTLFDVSADWCPSWREGKLIYLRIWCPRLLSFRALQPHHQPPVGILGVLGPVIIIVITMPWILLFFVLAIIEALPVDVSCVRLADIYWNATNPISLEGHRGPHHASVTMDGSWRSEPSEPAPLACRRTVGTGPLGIPGSPDNDDDDDQKSHDAVVTGTSSVFSGAGSHRCFYSIRKAARASSGDAEVTRAARCLASLADRWQAGFTQYRLEGLRATSSLVDPRPVPQA